MSHSFAIFDAHYRSRWIAGKRQLKNKKILARSEIEMGRTGNLTPSPEIILRRMPKDLPRDEARKPESDTFCYQLARALEGTEKMLLRGSPQDWPTVFYTLSILAQVHTNFPDNEDYEQVYLPLRSDLFRVIEELSSLYLFCCGDLHPLNQSFDIHCFGLMVRDTLATQHYEAMHKFWLEFQEGQGTIFSRHVRSLETLLRNVFAGRDGIPIQDGKDFFKWLEAMMVGFLPFE